MEGRLLTTLKSSLNQSAGSRSLHRLVERSRCAVGFAGMTTESIRISMFGVNETTAVTESPPKGYDYKNARYRRLRFTAWFGNRVQWIR